jgi:two-component system, NtrC family, sensor kinase|uniref:hybrid sensor histidine kinase/response regulator n=1 Tax=Cephaloticoccus sp. TaxID=1985742 RepID=UPI004049E24C
MALKNRLPRLSVQTKVLIPVLVFLVLLPTVTVWIVSNYITRQMQSESERTLGIAETVFQKLLNIRAADLLTRYRNEVSNANFKGLTTLRDTPTMNFYLGDLLDKFPDDEMALLLDDKGAVFAWSRKDSLISVEEFAAAGSELVRPALLGETGAGSVALNGRDYLIVAVPVIISGNGPAEWVLLVANRLGENAVQEFKSLTNTEIVLLAHVDNVAASTLQSGEARMAIAEETKHEQLDPDSEDAHPLELNGEHFLVQSGRYDPVSPRKGFSYLLLLSYEERLRSLDDTRRMLVIMSLVGILVSGVVVWGLVWRIIHPLRELSDAAEAVGRGDFSRRIEKISNDECGDLAGAFNRMTTNLRGSRAELESTVETLRATQQQLVQSEKLSAVGQFVAGVAHELNNPLTAVIGFSDLLSQVSTDEKMRPHLELIAKSAHRCHKIVQSLLSFARQHKPERKLVRINAVIDEVVEIMAYDLRTSNIEVVKQYGESLPEIMADPHQLQQVFVNIMSNARQALLTFRQDGRLVLATRTVGQYLRITFQDNGPGIEAENLRRIFDPFFTTKPVGKGTGLGLSLSYGIISEHGGRISAESQIGQGTTFIIDLPLTTENGLLNSESRVDEARETISGHGYAVLIIDDEEWILELAKAVLRNDGYQVVTALSGAKAIAALDRMNFDIIVTDWKMPGMSGMQFYEHLLDTNTALARRVLFMSGDVVNDVFNEFLKRHNRTCLTKPFELEEFRTAVAKVLKENKTE